MNKTTFQYNMADVSKLMNRLKRPVHALNLRDLQRRIGKREISLENGYFISKSSREVTPEACLRDFTDFMSRSMSIADKQDGYHIELKVNSDGIANSNDDSFSILIKEEKCLIEGVSSEGIRRGLFFLEDEMTLRRGPFLPLGEWRKTSVIKDRISRSPLAIYQQIGQELLDNFPDAYPDEYLNKMSHMGVNAIWVNGSFKDLIATKAIPELGPSETRLGKLVQLIDKAAKYGIKVFFFYMEPRLSLDHELFAKYPDIRGARFSKENSAGEYAICTSAPRVQDYLREVMVELFSKAPGLAGVIEIFHGERGTNCWMTGKNLTHAENGCCRCAGTPAWEGMAAKLNCIYEAIQSVSPGGKLLAWDYVPTAEKLKAIPFMNKDIIWLSCFEHGARKKIKGKIRILDEYSLSYTGPSHVYKRINKLTAECGMKIYSKLQMGNTYELPSEPFIPVPSSVYKKFKGMHETETSGTMLNWAIGGLPSMMFKVAGESSFAPLESEKDILKRAAMITWGEKYAKDVIKAWKLFFKSFSLYPMDNEVFYKGPITRSPGYHLNLEKEKDIAYLYNWGVGTFNLQPQPYEDDPARWTGTFTENEVIDSFREMAKIWEKGVDILQSLIEKNELKKDPLYSEMLEEFEVSKGILIQLLSAANVMEFYCLRKGLESSLMTDEKINFLNRMKELLEADTELALAMIPLVEKNPAMGFLSEVYYYSLSPELLKQKIENDKKTLDKINYELKLLNEALFKKELAV